MMGKKKELYQPVVGTRASICHWDLEFSFLTKEQCKKFIDEYMKIDMPIEFAYKQVNRDSFDPTLHIVKLNSTWADNLTDVAKILEKCDYQNEEYDD
jgi:hypothetical protein